TVGKNQIEVTLKTYRYSGQERDATGLYYYGARYYPPWLCRWLNPDPGGTIDGLNLYAFVGGNPVTKVDVGGYTGSSMTEETKKASSRNQALVKKGAAIKKATKRQWTAEVSGHSSTDSANPSPKRRKVNTG